MYYALCMISGIMSLFTRMVYYDTVFQRSSHFHIIRFLLSSTIFECILFLNTIVMAGNYSPAKGLLMMAGNFTVNYVLSMFYTNGKYLFRLIMAFSMQGINIVAEFGAVSILSSIHSDFQNSSGIVQDASVTVISGILSFFIILIISLLWKYRSQSVSLQYVALILGVPLSTGVLVILLPYSAYVNGKYSNQLLLTFQVLLMLNIFNYIAINAMLKQTLMKQELILQSKQLQFQSDKYEQISNAYRDTRRILHEMKRFNSFISSCAKKNECEKILDFLNENETVLEKRFIKINSGNLVIDTFISNLDSIANDIGITYSQEILVDKDDIPLNDYDLCIILGNLVDNCLNSCKTQIQNGLPAAETFISIKIYTKQNFFVLNAKNSTMIHPSEPSSSELYHGFGISNIKELVEKHNGVYFSTIEKDNYETTISLPILRDSTGSMIHPLDKITPVPPPNRPKPLILSRL